MRDAGTIQSSCPHCGQPMALSSGVPGQQMTCAHCGHIMNPSGQTPLTAVDLLAAFTGPVPRSPVSVFYQLGLVLVAVAMVVLPLVYVGLIGSVGWGAVVYAIQSAWLITSDEGGTMGHVFNLMFYFGPLFVALVVVGFLIKPLLARHPPGAQPLTVAPANEPTLFAFIGRICELVGTPMPQRIDLDCQLNAAASFRRGLRSLGGNDLVLTLGLPLVAGLSLREFAGVVAHELGHFRQGFAMRLSYLIRRINAWFAQVVYERDTWDVALEQWATAAPDARVAIVVGAARLAVAGSRQVLRVLMGIGHGVSCFLLRQMEYDADRCETNLAGSAAFESTVRRLHGLTEALRQTYPALQSVWKQHRHLPDDFPAYLLQHAAALPPATRQQIEATLAHGRTGWFDTHPSDADRLRRARTANAAGVFYLELPATVLFADFAQLARQVTRRHYADDLGLQFEPAMLRPVGTQLSES